ncbi:MAG: hypothetical protein L6R38_009222 [Xanthoria sp. 2 TBL-2021]|nr:MAG: hypothetical protein L6R38_009222 [Xanthoria sp. 2 TBL-2021]
MSSIRLASQHLLWKNHLGFLLHPTVALDVQPETFQVAEIGTRTGLWLLDMAKRLPNIQIDGFAIDTSSVPPPQWLPPNVTIRRVESYTTDLAPNGQSTYDVIRISNLGASIEDNDPGSVVKNAMAMLKPGGYIEWDELDTAHYSVVKPNPTHSASRLKALLKHVHEHDQILGARGWIDSLPDILARYGLQVQAGQHRYRLPFAYANVENDNCFKEFEELSYRLVDQEDGKKLRQLMAAAKEDCDQLGQMITADLVIVVGRKVY